MAQCRTLYLLHSVYIRLSYSFYVCFALILWHPHEIFGSFLLLLLLVRYVCCCNRLIYSHDVLLNRFSNLMNNRDTCNGSRSHSLIYPHTKNAGKIKAFYSTDWREHSFIHAIELLAFQPVVFPWLWKIYPHPH